MIKSAARKFGLIAVVFFTIKGLLWLTVPAALALIAL